MPLYGNCQDPDRFVGSWILSPNPSSGIKSILFTPEHRERSESFQRELYWPALAAATVPWGPTSTTHAWPSFSDRDDDQGSLE